MNSHTKSLSYSRSNRKFSIKSIYCFLLCLFLISAYLINTITCDASNELPDDNYNGNNVEENDEKASQAVPPTTTTSSSLLGGSYYFMQFTNAFVFLLIGMFSSSIQGGMSIITRVLGGFIYTEVVVKEYTQPFSWIHAYLATRPEIRVTSNQVKLVLQSDLIQSQSARMYGNRGTTEQQGKNEKDEDLIKWLPKDGIVHRIVFNNKYIWLSHYFETKTVNGYQQQECYYSLSCLHSKELIKQFVTEAHKHYQELLKQKTNIWVIQSNVFGSSNDWRQLPPRPSRPLNTVILANNTAEILINDMKEFINSESWYYEHGIPYRRGYLLHGPPGCGKTSFITAAAGELQLIICIINISSSQINDDSLIALLSSAPKHSIILLEDVDAAFTNSQSTATNNNGKKELNSDDNNKNKNNNNKDDTSNDDDDDNDDGKPKHAFSTIIARAQANSKSVTFSGLLNAIDGVAAQEGKMIFLTTNHVDRLDAALTRPGRVDLSVCFNYATTQSATQLFERFYCHEAQTITSSSASTSTSSSTTTTTTTTTSSTINDRSSLTTSADSLISVTSIVSSIDGCSADDIKQLATQFGNLLPTNHKYSMAFLQGHLMKYRKDPKLALSTFSDAISS